MMRSFISKTSFICTIFLLSACQMVPSAAPTEYKAAASNRGMGYAHEIITPEHYKITFTASSATGADQIQRYTLKRAAELAKAAGFDFIKLLRSDVTVTPTKGRQVTYKKTIQVPTLEDAPPCTMTGCGNDTKMFRTSVTDAQVSAKDMNIVVHSIEVQMLNEQSNENLFSVSSLLQVL